jgi:hypothetical protein
MDDNSLDASQSSGVCTPGRHCIRRNLLDVASADVGTVFLAPCLIARVSFDMTDRWGLKSGNEGQTWNDRALARRVLTSTSCIYVKHI